MTRVLLGIRFALTLGVALIFSAAAAVSSADAHDVADSTAKQKRVLILFIPAVDKPTPRESTLMLQEQGKIIKRRSLLKKFELRHQLALGLLGPTQGRYRQEQAFLDITQGSRTSPYSYSPLDPPILKLTTLGSSGNISGFVQARERASSAHADIDPGLLAASIPGGVAFAGVIGDSHLPAVIAANRSGDIAKVSLGSAATIASRAEGLLNEHRLVIAELPQPNLGLKALDQVLVNRDRQEMVIVLQEPQYARAPTLLPIGIAGLDRSDGLLTSESTKRKGIITGIDLTATVLNYLEIKKPHAVQGQVVTVTGSRDVSYLKQLGSRLRVIKDRRVESVKLIFIIWAALALLCLTFAGSRGFTRAMRIGSLAALWYLPVLLLTAALMPTKNTELVLIGCLTFVFGLLSDLLLRWPRAPILPALSTLIFYTVDLAYGSKLISQSLMGPNPRYGARYFGIGNELEALLPIIALIVVAVIVSWRRFSPRLTAALFAGIGLFLAVVIGSGRLGADVGGVITVSIGTTVACLVTLMPKRWASLKNLGLLMLIPVLAVFLLILLDLLTGGDAHLTRTVIDAQSSGELWDVVIRRYGLAFSALKQHSMLFLTVICLLVVVYALRNRSVLYRKIDGYPAWQAVFVGGLSSAFAGALFNDSGPTLFVFGVFLLAVLTAYLYYAPSRRSDADTVQDIMQR